MIRYEKDRKLVVLIHTHEYGLSTYAIWVPITQVVEPEWAVAQMDAEYEPELDETLTIEEFTLGQIRDAT